MATYDIQQLQAELSAAGCPVVAAPDGDRVYLVAAGGVILPEKAWPSLAVDVVARHKPMPPEPTAAERFDIVVEQAQRALDGASTVDQVKAVFAGTLDGLKVIYGTQGGP